jgi:hypothetical protein
MNTKETAHTNYLAIVKPLLEAVHAGLVKWSQLEGAMARDKRLTEKSQKLCDNVWLFHEKELALTFQNLCQDQLVGPELDCKVWEFNGELRLVR